MTAVVSPRRQVKLRWLRASSSASWKRKDTSRKVSTSSVSASSGSSSVRSAISGLWSSTSPTRSQHSRARGRMRITIWAIIRKNITRIAYSMTAEMCPTWKVPAKMRGPLSQDTTTTKKLMQKKDRPSRLAKRRLALMAVAA